jgi:predicted lipoprotein
MNLRIAAPLLGSILLLASAAHAGSTAEEKCQAGKNKAAGKYAACLAGAEKHAISGATEKYVQAVEKCQTKFQSAWTKLEGKAAAAGTECPSSGDGSDVRVSSGPARSVSRIRSRATR